MNVIASIVPAMLSALPMLAVPPAPIVTGDVPTRSMLSWRAGEVRCAGVVVGATIPRAPHLLVWGQAAAKPLRFRFVVDASGRPLTIVRTDGDAGYMASASDVEATLAGSRFPAAARQGCSVTFSPVLQPLATAPVDDLIAYSLAPVSGPLPEAAWQRIPAPGATCLAMPRPQPLLRAFPDFTALPATPGVRDWTLIGYDTGRSGRPRHVRVIAGTGNVALDKAGVRAATASRFTGGARTGCLYPYWRRAGRLPPPPIPEERRFRDAADTCPDDRAWLTQPVLRFPEPYRQRMIEGWAIVRYDIATWGEVGNVTVLAAEPSDDFGRQAVTVVRSAMARPSQRGAVGCIDRVRFVMGPDTMPPDPDGPPRPAY